MLISRGFHDEKKNENFPRSRKSQGNSIAIVKVSERSENLLVKSNALRTKSSQKRKEVENEKNINGFKKAKERVNMGCFLLIKGQ